MRPWRGAHAGGREQPHRRQACRAKDSEEIQTEAPAGREIIPVYDRTALVDRTIRTVETKPVRGRDPRRGRAAVAARQLAGGAHRRAGHPALAAVRHDRHGASSSPAT